MNMRHIGIKYTAFFLSVLSLCVFAGFFVAAPSGALAEDTGWFKVDGIWYYRNEQGENVTGWLAEQDKWYYLNKEGAMTTGWQKVGRKWYYMNRYGVMQTGWIRLSGKWYYLGTSGAMTTGFRTVDGVVYYFDNSGVMRTGWKKIDGVWYYFNKYGAMQSNMIVDGWLLGRSGAACEPAVGNTIRFGAYEQNGNASDGTEDIEWLVLSCDEDRILIISKYVLDRISYNEEWEEVTWETCELRAWLNSDFIGAAFNNTEQARIVSTTVSADKNPDYNTSAGNTVTDMAFLLSIPEANTYFASDSERQCSPTAYAVAQGVYADEETFTEDEKSAAWWWLRTPGDDLYGASYVGSSGAVDSLGFYAYVEYAGVRPAMWIDLGDR